MDKQYLDTLCKAHKEFRARQDGRREPDVRKTESGSWEIGDTELMPCCKNLVKKPKGFETSHLQHAKSLPHVAAIFSVKVMDLKAYDLKWRRNGSKYEKMC